MTPEQCLPPYLAARVIVVRGHWLWTGPISKSNGRPKCGRWIGGVYHSLPYRLALIYAQGPPPPGKPLACHRCNVPTCCRPLHLYWGSPADNGADVRAAGTVKGAKNPNSRERRAARLAAKEAA